jgi:cold shock CspA family protein
MAPSEEIEAELRTRAAKLEKYCRDIESFRVAVDMPHRHHEEGNRFSVRIDMKMPGEELAVSHGSNLHAAGQDLDEREVAKQSEIEGMRKHRGLVIKEAFDVARRRLQDYARRRRHDVKTHEEPAHGLVTQWAPVDEFGMIEATDGHELYFHRNSVIGSGLKHLRVGTEVIFVEEAGEKGPQASTVRVKGR